MKKSRIKKKRLFHCPVCKTVVVKPGICSPCLHLIEIGKQFDKLGFEVVSLIAHEHTDMTGFTDFVVYLKPLFRFTNYKGEEPKAVAMGSTWYARIDKGHLLHQILENEFQAAKNQ